MGTNYSALLQKIFIRKSHVSTKKYLSQGFAFGSMALLVTLFQNCPSKTNSSSPGQAPGSTSVGMCSITNSDPIAEGDFVVRYLRSTAGNTGCAAEKRICLDGGTLSGTFAFKDCDPNSTQPSSCALGGSMGIETVEVPYLGSMEAYRVSSASYGDSCDGSNVETRVCQSQNGETQLSGSYPYPTCLSPLSLTCDNISNTGFDCALSSNDDPTTIYGQWMIDDVPFANCDNQLLCTFTSLASDSIHSVTFVGLDKYNTTYNSQTVAVTTLGSSSGNNFCNPNTEAIRNLGIETDCGDSQSVAIGTICEATAPSCIKGFKYTCAGPGDQDFTREVPESACTIPDELVGLTTSCGGPGSRIVLGGEFLVKSGFNKDNFKFRCEADNKWTEILPLDGSYCVIPPNIETSDCGNGSKTPDDNLAGAKVSVGSICSVTVPVIDDPSKSKALCASGVTTGLEFGNWQIHPQ